MEQVLNDIENHLTEELDISELARKAFLSRFYFQRIFRATWGLGVGEYIRNRRLALAGEDLLNTDARVIEIAAKYGYDSPDSFRRAFVRFHGISPSEVRKYPERVRKFLPLSPVPHLDNFKHKSRRNSSSIKSLLKSECYI